MKLAKTWRGLAARARAWLDRALDWALSALALAGVFAAGILLCVLLALLSVLHWLVLIGAALLLLAAFGLI